MSRRGSSPVLVGRAAELATLETAFETVRQGGPAALLIGGEAGMGKTRLTSEFACRARAAGARVLTGACLELGADGLSFGPFTAMLRDLVRELGADEVAGLLPGSGPATQGLARLLPELTGERAATGSAGAGADLVMHGPIVTTGVLAADEARARLFEEFLSLLERLAAQRPLVLIVEDLHWADRSSRDLLAFLIGYQRALRNVLIIATFRSDELHRAHPLRPALAELARIDWVERAELPRLTRGQAEELAESLLGYPPDQAVIDALYQRAEGNPLFTEELLACSDGCDIIPDSLADLLLQAVRRLPEDTQEVLRIASAGSGATSHALLARVTGRAEDELAAVIRPAVAANVLVTSADGYAFRHALIQEAVHKDLLPGEHAAVHTRFGRAIEADASLASPRRAEIEKAHHWYSAHNTTGALTSAWRAASRPSSTVAHAERLMLLDRVLELWDQVPDAGAQIDADHVRVLQDAAVAAGDTGDHQRGLAFTELALAELDEASDPVRVALLLRDRHSFQRNLGLHHEMADLDRALSLVTEQVSRQARTQLLLATGHCRPNYEEPQFRNWAEEALRLARADGDAEAEAQALANLAMMIAGSGQLAAVGSEPLQLLAKARQVAHRTTAFHPVLKTVILESHLLCGAAEFERAAAVARQGIAQAERHGLARTSGAFLALNVAEPLYYLGRWDEAMEVTERALDLAPPVLTRVGLWIIHGQLALARGDLATAARRAAASRSVLASAGYEDQYHLPQAELEIGLALAADGPVAAVCVATRMLEAYDLSSSSPRYAWPVLLAAATAARQAPGEEAAALSDRLRTLADKLGTFGPVQRAWQLSFAALGQGTAHTVLVEDSPVDAAAAATAWEDLGSPYQAALALLHGARVSLAARDRQAAAGQLRRAASFADQLGAGPLAEQVAALARQAGEGADGDVLNLTSRELEVLRLVAAGRSNREIAAALVISPKTASVHVSNILAKLGASTRTEAAVRAAELLLLDIHGTRKS